MTTDNFPFFPDLLQQATDLVVRLNTASVSLLQRHFRLGYAAGLSLMTGLEASGIITPAGPDGQRKLTSFALW